MPAPRFELVPQRQEVSRLPPEPPGRPVASYAVFEYIAYTEQGENHGTMVLEGGCYFAIQFCRVISSRMAEPSCRQSSLDEYRLFWSYLTSTLYQYYRLRASPDACVSRRLCLQRSVSVSLSPLQCYAVNDTFFTSPLPSLLTFPLARVH